jgi:hypothetical protein
LVDRTESELKSDEGFVWRWEVGEVEVSNGDTITFGDFDSAQALTDCYLTKKNGGSEMTGTIALNVYTVTGAGTNIDCFYWVYGYKSD